MLTMEKPPTRKKILKIYARDGATAASEAAGVSKRTVQRWAAQQSVNSGYDPRLPLRGCPSVAAYSRGCRCEKCKEANKQAQKEIKARRVARLQNGEVEITHGASAYTNWDCRCEICKKSWSAYLRHRRNGMLDEDG